MEIEIQNQLATIDPGNEASSITENYSADLQEQTLLELELKATVQSDQDTDQVIETMGGSEIFVLKSGGRKPGLYIRISKKVKEDIKMFDAFVSAPVRVIGLVRDISNTSWGRLISFTDLDGHEHKPIIKMEDLGRNGEKVISDLRSMGLFVLPDPASLSRLIAYINNAIPEIDRRIRCTDKYGWHENVFVMPDCHIGTGEEEFLYQHSTAKLHAYSIQGAVEGWRENVAQYCRGNSRLLFSVSMAFAAPLLNIAEIENGGFHMYGTTSIGKSTALFLASSVMGNPNFNIQKWNATINALEATARHYNDALLPLDEIGQSDPKQIGDTTYMLGNGSGKARADTRGDARKRASFRNLFLSNGEKRSLIIWLKLIKKREGARRYGLLIFRLILEQVWGFLKLFTDSRAVPSLQSS